MHLAVLILVADKGACCCGSALALDAVDQEELIVILRTGAIRGLYGTGILMMSGFADVVEIQIVFVQILTVNKARLDECEILGDCKGSEETDLVAVGAFAVRISLCADDLHLRYGRFRILSYLH